AHDRSLGMLARRFVHGLFDSKPFAHHSHFAEGHASLGHAVRAGIHSEHKHFAPALPVESDITLIGPAGIDQGVIDAGNRLAESKRSELLHESIGDLLGLHADVFYQAVPQSANTGSGFSRLKLVNFPVRERADQGQEAWITRHATTRWALRPE